MTAASAPRAARAVGEEWARLARPTAHPQAFDPATVSALPAAARRWLIHAIAAGTPLWRTAELTMRGQIRIGTWRPFTARQVLTPPRGFIWAATARMLGIPVTGFDRLSTGTGEMRWRLAGLLPVMSATGPDVTRSAAGRLAGESTLVPTALTDARWAPGSDAERAVLVQQVDGEEERVELHVAADGRLLGALMQRWGNPGGAPFGRQPFGVAFDDERTFDGVTIGSVLRAGWWWGTERQDEGEFFRAEITHAEFR